MSRSEPPVRRLVAEGVVAALFFSSTFVINSWLAAQGDHWYWTATLRYVFVLPLALGLLLATRGLASLVAIFREFLAHLPFWFAAGGIGFGAFYLLLCFGATTASGWVVAATWQLTVVASLIVLWLLGQPVPRSGTWLAITVIIGVALINLGGILVAPSATAGGLLAILGAAFCYPLGNTLVGMAVHGQSRHLPQLDASVASSVFARLALMTAGAMPLLCTVGLLVRPALPSAQQLASTAFVAVATGVIATSFFLHARHRARSAFAIAAVDATQAAEVPFALCIQLSLLGGSLPRPTQFLGGLLVVAGLVGFAVRRPATSSA